MVLFHKAKHPVWLSLRLNGNEVNAVRKIDKIDLGFGTKLPLGHDAATQILKEVGPTNPVA